MSELATFQFEEGREVRILERYGEPWFVAKDVAEALGYPETTISNMPKMTQHIPNEWKGRYPIPTLGGIQNMLCISEQGLYFFLGRSDKDAALPFQKWIAGEVVPSIRKKGFYAVPGKDRQEQDEWKKNFPYPFLLMEDAASKMREMRHLLDKGVMTAQECRKAILGDFSPSKPDGSVNQFIRENLSITGRESDYVTVSDVYARYREQTETPYTRNALVRRITKAFPGLIYKQKKISGYPVLVFCGCRLKALRNSNEAENADK